MDEEHYVAQTYTYSWENHYAQAEALQQRFSNTVPQVEFDVEGFLQAYSKVIYRPLLVLLYCLRNNDLRITRRAFASCLPHQCKTAEIADNGKGILDKMQHDLTELLDSSGVLPGIDFQAKPRDMLTWVSPKAMPTCMCEVIIFTTCSRVSVASSVPATALILRTLCSMPPCLTKIAIGNCNAFLLT